MGRPKVEIPEPVPPPPPPPPPTPTAKAARVVGPKGGPATKKKRRGVGSLTIRRMPVGMGSMPRGYMGGF